MRPTRGRDGERLYRRVIVRRDPDEEFTRGGVAIPLVSQAKGQVGTVHAVAENELELRVGERVLFGPYSGSDVLVDGQLLTIMPIDEILGVLES